MKVICIDLSNPIDKHRLLDEDYLTIGGIYTVESSEHNQGKDYYYLTERPKPINRNRVMYGQWRFIKLEEQEEISIKNEVKIEEPHLN